MKSRYYKQVFLFETKKFVKYRWNIIFSFCSELLIPIMINILFLIGVSGAEVTKLQILELIVYIFFANVIYAISMTNIENVIANDIRTSKFTYKLLMPMNPFADYLFTDLVSKLTQFGIIFIPLFIIGFIFFQVEYQRLLLGVISIIISSVLGYSISFLIGILAFWLTEIWGIGAIKSLVFSVFAGTVFPLSFLPDFVQNLMMLSPFPYISYFPTAILIGELELSNINYFMSISFIWVLILMIIIQNIWKSGMKKYESVGV